MPNKPRFLHNAVARGKCWIRDTGKRMVRPFVGRHLDLLHRLELRIQDLERGHQSLASAAQTGLALGWDHAALVSRLAALEDRVESLTAQLERKEATEAETVSIDKVRAQSHSEILKARVG